METEMLSLTCNHCGAPLEAPSDTRFLTCSYCSAKLRIEHTGGAWSTSVLEQIQKSAETMASDVETIKLQNDLERVDREWALQHDAFLLRRKKGAVVEPDQGLTAIKMVFGLAVAGVIVINVASLAFIAITWLLNGAVGLLFTLVLGFGMVASWITLVVLFVLYRAAGERARKYREAKAAYLARREEVLKKITKP